MSQTSLPPRFCTHCGAALKAEDRRCTTCGTDTNRNDYRQVATVKKLILADPDATERIVPSDPDATERVGGRLLSRVSLQAAQRQARALAEQTDPLPELVRLGKVAHGRKGRSRKVLVACCLGLILLVLVPLAGTVFDHGRYAHAQQQAQLDKARLDQMIQHARDIGVPDALLQPLVSQENQPGAMERLLTLFPNPSGTNVYQQQARLYQQLQKQVPGVITMATQHAQTQARQDLQSFQMSLEQTNSQSMGNTDAFSQQLSQDQVLLAAAHTPGAYAAISRDARKAVTTLLVRASTFQQLADFQEVLSRMQAAHIDVAAMQAQYQHNVESFSRATQPDDFQRLHTQLSVQYRQLLVSSEQAFSYISAAMLNELTTQIRTLQSYGMDATHYQKRLDADQLASDQAKTLNDQVAFFKQVDGDIAAMHNDLERGKAHYLVAQYQQELASWSKAHLYHDNEDGHDYSLVSGYMQQGIGSILNNDLAHASSLSDEEAVIAEAQNALFNLRALEADYGDRTPFDQVHATDLKLLENYHLQDKQVLMVSLVEQAMRIYQHGKLQRSYQVTTGRQELPSLPGVWSVLDRKSPVTFTSGEPRNSPYWFPDTPISYAILYHYGGYYVHDAPWRADFGPGTQFPHQDSGGTTRYNFDGSHGCINLPESATAWVYNNTDWNTIIVIY